MLILKVILVVMFFLPMLAFILYLIKAMMHTMEVMDLKRRKSDVDSIHRPYETHWK